MKKNLILTLSLALAACGKAPAPAAKAKIGAPAPAVTIEKMLAGDLKSLKSWDDLGGKAVVLEFWGTDCGPCVSNIPHMNELVEKFRDKPVVFIQVSREKEETVREFLAKTEMKGNVAAEAAGAFKSYRVFGIPHAVLIDRKGVLAGRLHPAGLRADAIEDLLAGRKLKGSAGEEAEEAAAAEDDGKALAFFTIGAAGDKPDLRYGGNTYQADGLTLDYILETAMKGAHGVEFIGVPDELKLHRYKVSARVPLTGEDDARRLREFFASGISAALPLQVSLSVKERKVYLLKRAGAAKPGLVKVEVRGGSRKMNHGPDGAYMEAEAAGLDDLAAELETWLGKPVLDETGLPGHYNYKIKVAELGLKAVNAELADKLGLKLEEARREVEVVEVRAVKSPKKRG
ncbi:MAG: DUF3738 domain-containing protein [Elusimicrobiales bacterium]|nr:DUF3738 domain-containing protein [Elusimicrobiales bacterium]